MSDQIPELTVTPEKRSLWDRVSVVWLVPLIALVVALSVAWQSYNDRGPVIEIIFDSAAGISKEETELRFRDIAVGVVEDVHFTPDLDRVVVAVRLDKAVAAYIDAETEFWIVRPEVTTQGVTGLDTVLSGVYIQGLWDDEVGTLTYAFEGLSQAPLLAGGQTGLTMTLRSTDGSLSGNTPIVFKGVEVGRIGPAMVSTDGFSVEAQAVVYFPYDNLVTSSTRFWDTSGFSLSVGTSGAAVDFDSLSSLIAGGVTFDTFVSGAVLARDGDQFDVFADSATARASVFNRTDGVSLDLVATFDGNVAGLATGAAVEFNGLRIGEVTGLNGVVDETPSGGTRVRLQTVLSIQPARLGMDGAENADEALRFLAEQVAGGLRARLTTGSLLTGGLKVQLIATPDAPPAILDMNARPFPSIPVTESEISDVASTAQDTLNRIDNLPIEELLDSATSFLNNAALLVGSAETQAVPGDVSALLTDLRAVVGSDDVQALPEQLGGLMAELEATVSQVRGILEAVEQEETIARATAAINGVATLSAQIDASLAGVPALITEVTELANRAGGLELEALVAEVTGLAQGAATLFADPNTQALPEQLAAAAGALQTTLGEAEQVIAGLNAGEGVARLLTAVDAAGAAAVTLEASLDGVPDLITQIEAVAANAATLPLADLVAEITGLSARAQALIGSDAAQALPAQLGALSVEMQAALAEVTGVVAQLNEGDAVARVLSAVDAVWVAASSVEGAVEGVPALIARVDTVVASAEGLDLEALIAQVTGLVASADALVAGPDTQELPGALADALAELSAIMAELRRGGAVENTNAALLSARDAADQIAAATAGLPALLARANALIAQADTTLGGFEGTSPAIRDARDALREVQEAAAAVQSLARALERSPLLRR